MVHDAFRRTVAVFAVLALLLGLTVTAQAAGPDGQGRDVTATPRGRALAETAARRFAERGFPEAARSLRVIELAPDDHVVLPADVRLVGQAARVRDDGAVEYEMSVEVAGPAGDDGLIGRSAAADPTDLTAASAYWAWRKGGCFARVQNSEGYSDSCYRINSLYNDGDGARDYWQLEQWSTAGAKLFRKLYESWVEGRRTAGTATQAWIDWSPRGDVSGGCTSLSLLVKAQGIPISGSAAMCEHWDITKYEEAGRFRTRWHCGCIYPLGQPYPEDREAAYMIAVSVAQGRSPVWTLSLGYLAW